MSARQDDRTRIERASACELVVTRLFNAPAQRVYAAWTRPELFKRWWTPQSMGASLFSCEMDVRTGGSYRLAFGADAATALAFHGR